MVDGTFDFIGNAIKVKSAPKETIDVLTTLKLALADAQGGNKTAEQILDDIKQAAPEIAESAQHIVKNGGINALIGILLYLITLYSQSTHQTLDLNVLLDQLHNYTTGAPPYPFDGKSHLADNPNQAQEKQAQAEKHQEQTESPSRQQRRQLERRSKKSQAPSKQPSKK